ncbi:YheT family hydrolase [Aequorivita marisscotiae]|uniref:Alpha/beta fold hydrolase n=1 Tax=Aequorivita marisscotiae TaxID=3040348 RepID=A0ABY8KYJ4_9FLAO|nr:alpha/beta fold hydrolase [Aequorivita sp. Ant34-E75]WGF92901.1 alpha/beta fold hydrolase [Aequorivita sp. Ant34-E75]
MPYINNSSYETDFIFQNGHISTIYEGIIRKLNAPNYKRKRLLLPDGDFLLLDYIVKSSKKAIILCHGLEGDSRKNYNNACANFFIAKGYSVFAWNNRSCGGEMNLLPYLYHHGSITDLEFVIEHVIASGFEEVFPIGFSLGGDQILNYLGRNKISDKVKAAVAISAPIQLKSSAEKIQSGISKIYLSRFIRKIRAKIQYKSQQFPDIISQETSKQIKTFEDVILRFIVPVHGDYLDLEDYYLKASPKYSIDGIKTPVLVMNAWDDPILGKDDHPIALAERHKYLFLETPHHGGHCAFPLKISKHPYSVVRAFEFFEEIAK